MLNIIFFTNVGLFFSASVFSILSWKSDNVNYSRITRFLFAVATLAFLFLGILWINILQNRGLLEILSHIWGYFYLLSLLLIIVIFYLYFSKWRSQLKSFIALAIPFITIVLLISTPFLHSSRKIIIDADYNVLTAHILPVHVFIMIMGELLFFLSFIGSILYLIMEMQLRKKTSMSLIYRLPNIESIENFNRWSITRSLILISLGIFIGMIMLFINYDSLSLGTAKEMHIYFSWIIIFGIYFIRRFSNVTSKKASIINIILFIIVMFLFIFTNIFITKGFHSFR